jgi:YihY family inner membrane protein
LRTARTVPETRFGSKRAKETIRNTGFARLLRDSFVRFRTADGTTHTRAFAHSAVLTGVPALVAVIGMAAEFNMSDFQDVLEHSFQRLAPGTSGGLLESAFKQGAQGSGGTAFVVGSILAIISGTFSFLQIERGFNRIYGIDDDPSLRDRLWRGLLLAASAGTMLALSFILLAAGGALGEALAQGRGSETLSTVFTILRWPVGLLLTFIALTLIFKRSPARRQPGAGWLQSGTVPATFLWFTFSVLLGMYYSLNDQLGQALGPLLGIIAIVTWAYATGLALFLGAAFAAELEAKAARA